MSHGWDIRTVIETAVSHRWACRIQREQPVLPAARNVLIIQPVGTVNFVFVTPMRVRVRYLCARECSLCVSGSSRLITWTTFC